MLMEPGQRAQADTSDTADLLPLLLLKRSKGKGRARDAVGKGERRDK